MRDARKPAPATSFSLPHIDVSLLISWLLARWYWVLIGAVVGTLIGIGYGMGAKPRYTVYTDLLVPPANLQVLPNDIYVQNQQGDTQLLDVESKMLVLTSGNVLRRVVSELGLASDPELSVPMVRASVSGRCSAASRRLPTRRWRPCAACPRE